MEKRITHRGRPSRRVMIIGGILITSMIMSMLRLGRGSGNKHSHSNSSRKKKIRAKKRGGGGEHQLGKAIQEEERRRYSWWCAPSTMIDYRTCASPPLRDSSFTSLSTPRTQNVHSIISGANEEALAASLPPLPFPSSSPPSPLSLPSLVTIDAYADEHFLECSNSAGGPFFLLKEIVKDDEEENKGVGTNAGRRSGTTRGLKPGSVAKVDSSSVAQAEKNIATSTSISSSSKEDGNTRVNTNNPQRVNELKRVRLSSLPRDGSAGKHYYFLLMMMVLGNAMEGGRQWDIYLEAMRRMEEGERSHRRHHHSISSTIEGGEKKEIEPQHPQEMKEKSAGGVHGEEEKNAPSTDALHSLGRTERIKIERTGDTTTISTPFFLSSSPVSTTSLTRIVTYAYGHRDPLKYHVAHVSWQTDQSDEIEEKGREKTEWGGVSFSFPSSSSCLNYSLPSLPPFCHPPPLPSFRGESEKEMSRRQREQSHSSISPSSCFSSSCTPHINVPPMLFYALLSSSSSPPSYPSPPSSSSFLPISTAPSAVPPSAMEGSSHSSTSTGAPLTGERTSSWNDGREEDNKDEKDKEKKAKAKLQSYDVCGTSSQEASGEVFRLSALCSVPLAYIGTEEGTNTLQDSSLMGAAETANRTNHHHPGDAEGVTRRRKSLSSREEHHKEEEEAIHLTSPSPLAHEGNSVAALPPSFFPPAADHSSSCSPCWMNGMWWQPCEEGEREGRRRNYMLNFTSHAQSHHRFILTRHAYWQDRAVWLRTHFVSTTTHPSFFSTTTSSASLNGKKKRYRWMNFAGKEREKGDGEEEEENRERHGLSFLERMVKEYFRCGVVPILKAMLKDRTEEGGKASTSSTIRGAASSMKSESQRSSGNCLSSTHYVKSCPQKTTSKGEKEGNQEEEEEGLVMSAEDIQERIFSILPFSESWLSTFPSCDSLSILNSTEKKVPLPSSTSSSFPSSSCDHPSASSFVLSLLPHELAYHILRVVVEEAVRFRPRDVVTEALNGIRRGVIRTVGELAFILCLSETPTAYFYVKEVLEAIQVAMKNQKGEKEEGEGEETRGGGIPVASATDTSLKTGRSNDAKKMVEGGIKEIPPHPPSLPPTSYSCLFSHSSMGNPEFNPWPSPVRAQSFILSVRLRHYIDEGFLAHIVHSRKSSEDHYGRPKESSFENIRQCPKDSLSAWSCLDTNYDTTSSSSPSRDDGGGGRPSPSSATRYAPTKNEHDKHHYLPHPRGGLPPHGTPSEEEIGGGRMKWHDSMSSMNHKAYFLFKQLSVMQRGLLQIAKMATTSVNTAKNKEDLGRLQELWSSMTAAIYNYDFSFPPPPPLPLPPLPSTIAAIPTLTMNNPRPHHEDRNGSECGGHSPPREASQSVLMKCFPLESNKKKVEDNGNAGQRETETQQEERTEREENIRLVSGATASEQSLTGGGGGVAPVRESAMNGVMRRGSSKEGEEREEKINSNPNREKQDGEEFLREGKSTSVIAIEKVNEEIPVEVRSEQVEQKDAPVGDGVTSTNGNAQCRVGGKGEGKRENSDRAGRSPSSSPPFTSLVLSGVGSENTAQERPPSSTLFLPASGTSRKRGEGGDAERQASQTEKSRKIDGPYSDPSSPFALSIVRSSSDCVCTPSSPFSLPSFPLPSFQSVDPCWKVLGFPSDNPKAFYETPRQTDSSGVTLPSSSRSTTMNRSTGSVGQGNRSTTTVRPSATATSPSASGKGPYGVETGHGVLGLSVLHDFSVRYPEEFKWMVHYNQQGFLTSQGGASGPEWGTTSCKKCIPYSLCLVSSLLLTNLLIPLRVGNPVGRVDKTEVRTRGRSDTIASNPSCRTQTSKMVVPGTTTTPPPANTSTGSSISGGSNGRRRSTGVSTNCSTSRLPPMEDRHLTAHNPTLITSPFPFYDASGRLPPIWGMAQFSILYDRLWCSALYRSFERFYTPPSSPPFLEEERGEGEQKEQKTHMQGSRSTSLLHDVFSSSSPFITSTPNRSHSPSHRPCPPSSPPSASFHPFFTPLKRWGTTEKTVSEQESRNRKKNDEEKLLQESSQWTAFADFLDDEIARSPWWMPPSSSLPTVSVASEVRTESGASGELSDRLKSDAALQKSVVEGFYELHHQLLRHFHECWVEYHQNSPTGSSSGGSKALFSKRRKSAVRDVSSTSSAQNVSSLANMKQFIDQIVMPKFFFPLAAPYYFPCLFEEKVCGAM